MKDALGRVPIPIGMAIVKFTGTGLDVSQTKEFYVYGNERVAMITPNTLGTTPSRIQYNEATYFLTDHLGNTRVAYMATTTSGSSYIINALDYYPYGKVLREYDNGAGDKYLTTQHERDQETGLDYRGARYYDSDIARFLSTDPWANKYPAWSTYNYVMGNPLRLIDPSGKGPTDWFLNVKTGNLIYVKGTSEITQKEIDKYGWDSSPSDYKRLGADNMFGDKVEWVTSNVLDKNMYCFYNYSEYFMETQGYVKGREYDVVETMNTTGGRQGDEDYSTSTTTYKETKGDLTYAKPKDLNKKENFDDDVKKGFCWTKTTVTYNTVVEYNKSPRSSAFFPDNAIGTGIDVTGGFIEIAIAIITRNKVPTK